MVETLLIQQHCFLSFYTTSFSVIEEFEVNGRQVKETSVRGENVGYYSTASTE